MTSEGSMPDGVTIIDKLDEPSMGESSFKGTLPPLGGSPVTLCPQGRLESAARKQLQEAPSGEYGAVIGEVL